jgi:hypothetical protein
MWRVSVRMDRMTRITPENLRLNRIIVARRGGDAMEEGDHAAVVGFREVEDGFGHLCVI